MDGHGHFGLLHLTHLAGLSAAGGAAVLQTSGENALTCANATASCRSGTHWT